MSQDVNDGAADTGEPTEGSSPSETMVPLSVMLAERGRHEDKFTAKVAELEGKINAVATNPAHVFTRAELQVQVDDGRMTQDESDRIILDQMKTTVTKDVTQDLKEDLKAERLGEILQADIDCYKAARPDIMKEGSDDRILVTAEFNRQIAVLGKPDSPATERDALATLFGPSNRLQNGKAKEAQTFQETGGDGDSGDGSPAGWAKEMPPETKRYYQDLINKGIFADQKAANEEWSYKPKHGRR